MTNFRVGTKVQWKWLGRKIQGVVLEVFNEPVERTIKGKKIKRNASKENPAYFVESEAGNHALKLASELEAATADSKSSKPRMFSKD